jgi:hypothetical protein
MDDEQEIYKLWRISKISAFEIVLFDFFLFNFEKEKQFYSCAMIEAIS